MAAKGDYDYATEMYTQCVTGDPANVIYTRNFLGNLAKKYNNNKKGSKLASIQGLGTKGSMKKAVLSKDWKGTITSGVELLKLNPWDTGVLLDMARACEALECDETQLEYLRMALDAGKDDVEVNRVCGRGFGRQGVFDEAIVCWDRVRRAKPTDEEAARAIQNLQIEKTIHKGGYEDAQSTRDARLNRGGDEEDDESARLTPEARLQRQIDKDPSNLEKYIELVDLLSRDEKYDEAEKVLQQALAASGGSMQIAERLDDVQIRGARQQLEIAKKQAEADRTKEAIELYNRMRAELNSKELEVYAHRVERYPANTGFRYELAIRLQKSSKPQEAIKLLQECRGDIKRRTAVLMALGRCFFDIKQYELALNNFQSAVESEASLQSEEKKQALYAAGTLAFQLKDYEKAKKNLNELASLDFAYKDISKWLDKLRQLRDDDGSYTRE